MSADSLLSADGDSLSLSNNTLVESGKVSIESCAAHTAAVATLPDAYSMKIVTSTKKEIESKTYSSTTTAASPNESCIANKNRTFSVTASRRQPAVTTHHSNLLQELTHYDTAEYTCARRLQTVHEPAIKMVYPTDSLLYDFDVHNEQQQLNHPSDAWNGEPIPIDDVDYVFHPTRYSNQPLTQQPQQQQMNVWSVEEDSSLDLLIERAIEDEASLDGIDLNVFDLDESSSREVREEEEPLTEFFPELGEVERSVMATERLEYHELATRRLLDNPEGEWLRMAGNDQGRIDSSPTFMDTSCDLSMYANDWTDGTMSSKCTHDDGGGATDYTTAMDTHQSSARAVRLRRTAVNVIAARVHPYKGRATATTTMQPPVFRPGGFGTPAQGGDVDEYRMKRDKNNVSSARSRAKRSDKMREMKVESVELEKKNIKLKAMMEGLEKEVGYYKQLMLATLIK